MPPQGTVPQSTYQPSPTSAPLPPLTMGKFKASRAIVRESWAILKQDKEIMWFPVLSAVTSIIALIIMGAALFFLALGGSFEGFSGEGDDTANGLSYVILFVYYLVMFFITNFFQEGIYVIAHGRFNGRDLSFSDGMAGATDKMGKIFAWSFISATVGVILQMIAGRSKLIGKIVAGLLGAAWNILTYFSLPSLIIGNTSVENSFKESAAVIRKTWGETIIVNLGVGLFFMLLFFLGLALGVGIVVLVPDLFVGLGVSALFIVYVIGLTVISSALGSIFKLAIYEYATTGKVPQGFSPELVQHAVRAK